jgi:hypothetical protein
MKPYLILLGVNVVLIAPAILYVFVIRAEFHTLTKILGVTGVSLIILYVSLKALKNMPKSEQ